MLKVFPTEKSLVVLFWRFFEISRQPRRIRKNQNYQNKDIKSKIHNSNC